MKIDQKSTEPKSLGSPQVEPILFEGGEIERLREENADLRASIEQITLLQELIREVNKCQNTRESVEAVLQILPQLVACFSCQVFLYRGDRFRKLGEQVYTKGNAPSELNEETIYWACKRDTVMVLPDEGTGHNVTVVPMSDGIQMMGAILINQGSSFAQYNTTTNLLLKTLGDHLGLALSQFLNTERLEKEVMEHAEVREYFDRVLASMGHPVISLDSDGNITLFNPPAEDFLEIREKIAVGNPYTLILPEDLSLCMGEILLHIQGKGVSVSREVNFQTPFKTKRHMRINASPLRVKGTSKSGVVCVCEDLTPHRELEKEKELSRFRQDFFTLVANKMEAPLLEALEINNQMETVIPNTHSPVLRQKLEDIKQIVTDVLDLTRLEMDQVPFSHQVFGLNDLLREIHSYYEVRAQAINMRCELELDEDDYQVTGDRFRLHQVLNNLMSNALKYSLEGSVVKLVLRPSIEEKGSVEVLVSDTGLGIGEQDKTAVFNPFLRLRNKVSVGGIGLGLPLSQEILKRFHSTLKLSTELGKGSTFSFLLKV